MDTNLHTSKPETAKQLRERLAAEETRDIMRARPAEQDVLDLIDQPMPR